MTVRIAGTEITNNLNVIRQEFVVRWMGSGVGVIDLTPYLVDGTPDTR